MRVLKVIYLLLGLGLLALVIAEIDIAEVAAQVSRIGLGFLVILAIYLVAFAIDTVTWQMTLPSIPLNALWAYRAWKVRMVGEAFNMVMPGGGMGGEPLKAVLLKKHYGVGFREGAASLILAKTINMIALVAFLVVGFALTIGGGSLPASYETVAAAGLAGLSVAVALFFIIQRFGVTSLTGSCSAVGASRGALKTPCTISMTWTSD